MNGNKSWIISISLVSIINGIIESFLPDGKYKKMFRFSVGIILLYVIIQPLTGINAVNFSIDNYLSDNYEISENIDIYAQKAIVSSAEKAIEDMFIDFARDHNINYKVKCICSVSEDQISIDKIYITDYKPADAYKTILTFAVSSGIDKNKLIFKGGKNEE